MNDGISGTAVFSFFKAFGLKAGMGMIGAAMLYIVLPPKDTDGSFNEKEFVLRLAFAGCFSCMFGDWAVDVLRHNAEWLQLHNHARVVDILVGAPGWWISRAVAIAMYKRRDKGIDELYKEGKGVT